MVSRVIIRLNEETFTENQAIWYIHQILSGLQIYLYKPIFIIFSNYRLYYS